MSPFISQHLLQFHQKMASMHCLRFPFDPKTISDISHIQFTRLLLKNSPFHNSNSFDHPSDGEIPENCQYLLSSHYDGTICCWIVYGGGSNECNLASSFLFQFHTTSDKHVGVLYFDVDPNTGAVYSANTDGTIRQHFPFKCLKHFNKKVQHQFPGGAFDSQSLSTNIYGIHDHAQNFELMNLIEQDQIDEFMLKQKEITNENDENDGDEELNNKNLEKVKFEEYLKANKNRIIDHEHLLTVENKIIGRHAEAVNHVFYIPQCNCVVSGSWDGHLKYWDVLSPNSSMPLLDVDVLTSIQAMDLNYPLLVVATAQRNILLYDLDRPNVLSRSYKSALKLETNKGTLKIFPDRYGFLFASVEGRCSIRHFDDTLSNQNFVFKCHRSNMTQVHSVNGADFHPFFGTFVTCGGDCKFFYWDKNAKQKLYSSPELARQVSHCKFNTDGSMCAIVSQYDYSKGKYGLDDKPDAKVAIFIHQPSLSEIRNKGEPPYRTHLDIVQKQYKLQ